MNQARGSARSIAARLSTPAGLIVLFAIALGMRLAFAHGDGHVFDMVLFRRWAERFADHGPWTFYPQPGEDFFVDYPPGYLYVLWGVARVARYFELDPVPAYLLKLPAIIADLGLALVVMRLAERLTPAVEGIRALAAAAVLLNPSVIFVSAIWGQVEAVAALFIVWGLLVLGTGRPTLRREAAGMALLAVAVGTKPQAAFVLPVVVLVLVYRHSREGWLRGFGRWAVIGGAGLAAGILLLAPFRLGPLDAVDFYANAAGIYKLTSLFAYNLWGVFGFFRPDTGTDAFRVVGVPAFAVGLALFSIAGSVVLARAWLAMRRSSRGPVLVFGSVALSLVGFAFLTRIHERYLFVPVVVAAALVGLRAHARAFAALSLLYLANLLHPYLHHYGSAHRADPWFGPLGRVLFGTAASDPRPRIFSAAITLFCVFIAWRGWRWLGADTSGRDEIEHVERQDTPQVHETT
ncbi:MAG: hypothetical protein ACRDKJ_04545 [Actinomycetota bacterium]